MVMAGMKWDVVNRLRPCASSLTMLTGGSSVQVLENGCRGPLACRGPSLPFALRRRWGTRTKDPISAALGPRTRGFPRVHGRWKLVSADISPDEVGGKSGPLAWEVESASDDRAQPGEVLSPVHPGCRQNSRGPTDKTQYRMPFQVHDHANWWHRPMVDRPGALTSR
jgi:hypothetical protein